MPDPDQESMEGEAGREGGNDDEIVVPIITPTTVGWFRRLIQKIQRKE